MRAKSISERERPFAGGRYRRVDGGESGARRRTSVTHTGAVGASTSTSFAPSSASSTASSPVALERASTSDARGVSETATDITRAVQSLNDMLNQMHESAAATVPSSEAMQRAADVLNSLVEREQASHAKSSMELERAQQPSTGAEELARAQDGIDQVLHAATRAWCVFTARRQRT